MRHFLWFSLPNRFLHSRCICLCSFKATLHACSCCSRCLNFKSQFFSNVVSAHRAKHFLEVRFSLAAFIFVVDSGVETREVNEKDPIVVSFSSMVAIATVSKSKMLSVVSHDSFGNTCETYECTATSQSRARGSRDNFAIAGAQHEGSHSIWCTNQLCSFVNIRGSAKENSPPGREVSSRVTSTKEVLVRFE